MTSAQSQLAAMPIVPRFAIVGSTALGMVGALVGAVAGLVTYPPTAWFAVLEVGVPAGIAGAAVGACIGLTAVIGRKAIRR